LAAFAVGLVLALRFDGPLGGALHRLAPAANATTARIGAFLAILVVLSIAAGLLIGRLNRLLGRLPVVGTVNRLGGVAMGVVLAIVAVWLVTAALLSVPSSLLPYSGAVHHSATARLLRAATPRWSRELRDQLDNLTASRRGSSATYPTNSQRSANESSTFSSVMKSQCPCPMPRVISNPARASRPGQSADSTATW
jgi:hypothetical protein